jgi:hypothetical protein
MVDNIKKAKPIGFQLNKITTEQFAIIEEVYNSSAKTNMGLSLNFGLDRENKFIAAFVKVQFEQKGKAFLIVEVGNHFKINESSWVDFEKTKETIILPKGFAAHLVMLTIGTLRGVLHAKTENIEFNKFLLPTINVVELIKEDVELN